MKFGAWGILGIVLVAGACAVAPGDPPAPSSSASAPSTSASGDPLANPDPSRYASQVVNYAREAGINAQLLMAILYNENYKPHDPAAERAWQKIKPDAAFGVANMHKATFDETKRSRPFAGRAWDELPDDPGLAIEAAAWYLHDLKTSLPAAHAGFTTDELLALGYNTGPGNMRAFAKGTKPGSAAQSYLDSLHSNWGKAAQALQHS
ncbi:transglycosylase SLT domain-containing protein [Amycolatopsis taiwanensis]|uniref:transglycosylase SLT domain-containing protein n=1 Tax=Amycolatopsis taiwanensis TaxID=342230 RepID=UPI0004AD65F4|nr:transglycosylase SLT domain-containing protein [Amycolatopsis taiwanensis]